MVAGVPDWTGAPPEAMEGFIRASSAQFASELIAEAIVRTLDDILHSLSDQLRSPVVKKNESANTKSGARLRFDVAIDELLDAFGNAPRHRSEWRRDTSRAKRTLKTLARFYSGNAEKRPLDQAFLIVRGVNEQALGILEALAPGDSAHEPVVSFPKLMSVLIETGNAIVTDHWDAWAEWENARRENLRSHQVEVEAHTA
jgi:hypothetical protein